MSSFAKKLDELKLRYRTSEIRIIVPVFLFILVCGIVAVSFSFCTKTDVVLRTFAPKDTIIYLESNDIGGTLNSLTENESFKKISVSKPDFSALKGIQVAVAIAGFETSENRVTDEQSVLNFKPKFTVIAETHAWSWQVNSLVENNLNSFVVKTYGNDTKLERRTVNGTERFVWTASDGRKTFAVISDSQVFFGNDEESVNKCLSAKRNETENLLANENLSAAYEKAKGKLAFGFVSNSGIKQIADVVGVSVAVGQTENANARGFIAEILPQILNNSTKEITWTAEKIENGIKDEVFIRTEKEISNVLSETLVPANKNINELYEFLPDETSSVTRYNLKNSQIAFRSLLLLTAKNTDAVNAKLIAAFSNSLLSQYGISDAEGFLSEVESELITAKTDTDGEKPVAIVKAKDVEKIKTMFLDNIKQNRALTDKEDAEIWNSEEDNLSIAFQNRLLILGDSGAVSECLSTWRKRKLSPIESDKDFTIDTRFAELLKSNAATATFSLDKGTAENIVKVLGIASDNKATSQTLTETRFNKQGIERTYISDFGFLGTLIEQFAN